MLFPLRALYLIASLACAPGHQDPDLDQDGVPFSQDCDDQDPLVFPGADELCDGIDNDCDGTVDGPDSLDALSWAPDADGDQFGDPNQSVTECTQPSGYVQDTRDCDDSDAEISPLADEIYYDGVDQNCDGLSDYDADEDGEDALEHGGTDCDDNDLLVNTAAEEIWYDGVDQDCDGLSDYDADGDGVDSIEYGGTDCDDGNPTILPGVEELWYDGVDQNCDGWSDYDKDGDGEDLDTYGGTDCNDEDAAVLSTATELYYDGVDQDCDGWSDFDADRDGEDSLDHGGVDCDDADATILTTAAEVYYDGVDQNCDGLSDYDADEDGEDSESYGGVDCDDADGAINTTAAEVYYDGVDQNCDDLSDYDADEDGEDSESYGGVDCDDSDSAINTLATESYYDGVDQNCDDLSDYDADEDGEDSDSYGGADCDDSDSSILSTATEIYYDGVDQNCDGLSDYDADEDGQDSESYGGVDCDDSDAAINTLATESYYDGVDQDCDGLSDYDQDLDGEDHEDHGGTDCDDLDASVLSTATEIYYDGVDQNCDDLSDYDADEDGYDSDSYSGLDCDDTDSAISPDAAEIAHDSIDQNCDGFDGPEVDLSTNTGTLTALESYDPVVTADLVVNNSGEGTLTWSASADKSWVSLSSTTGSGGDVLSLSADTSALSAGSYSATVTVLDTVTGSTSDTYTLTLEVAETWSGTANTSLTYDGSGRVETRTDATGEVLTYAYDGAGRLESIEDSGGDALELGYNTEGLLDTYTSSAGTLSLSYTGMELDSASYPSGDSITYTWDSSGRITQRTLPSGAVIKTTYSTTYPALPAKIVHSEFGSTTFTYDTDGRPSTRTLPNGTTSSWTYESTFGKAQTVSHEDGSGNTLLELSYSYDDLGRIDTLTRTDDSGSSRTVTYGYDALGRLESETWDDGTTRSWVYDSAGNRSQVEADGDSSDTLVDSANRLLAQDDTVFEYDEAGRMTKRISAEGTTTFTWDAYGRLESVTQPDGEVIDYAYSANDLLLTRADDDADSTFFYDLSADLPRLLQIETDDGSSVTDTHYLWAGRLSGVEHDGSAYDVLGDHTGTVHGFYDGSSVAGVEYDDAFGQISSTAGLDSQIGSSGFAEGWTDPDTGLVYLWHRWYDPSTGRFISPDLLSQDAEAPETHNQYIYCQGDPVNYMDPTGLFLDGADWGMIGSGVASIAGAVVTLAVIATAPVTAPAAGIAAGVAALVAVTNIGFGTAQVVVGANGGLPDGTTMPGSLVDVAAMIAKAQTDNPAAHIFIDGAAIIADMAIPSPDKSKLTKRLQDVLDRYGDLTEAQRLKKINDWANEAEKMLREHAEMQEKLEGGPDIPADDERGGIYINASATVIGDLSQLNGAGIDESTGQLIFYGEDGGITTTGLDGDLLYTALQWMGNSVDAGSFTAPGVTIEPDLVPTEEPTPPDSTNTYHGVGYFGGIEYTEMGNAAFDADRIMKGLSMGVDNEDTTITYDATSLGVSAFETHIDFYESYYDGTSPAGWVRMWIEPDVMELTVDGTREAFEFTESTMIVQYEDQTDTTAVWDDYEDFTDLLTTYYDDIAVEIESWEDLRTASQAVSVAYWLYYNDYHLDLAWDYIYDYEVEYYDTDWWTLEGEVTSSFDYGGTTITTTHRGGANTTTFSDIYSSDTTGDVQAYWDEIEAARSSDLVDSWTYTSPDGDTGVAVALPGRRVAMPGAVTESFNDLFAPVAGSVPLEVVRSYSSAQAVDGLDRGMGPGWAFVEYSTRLAQVEETYSTTSAPVQVEVFDHRAGRTLKFELDGFSGTDGVYSCTNMPLDDLSVDSSGWITWEKADGTVIEFDDEGQLTTITSVQGDAVDYSWSSNQLTAITHSDGDSITLSWDSDGMLSGASTSAGWSVSYSYDADGNLSDVTDAGGQDWSFSYSSDGLMDGIEASDGTEVFSATYDDMGRATDKGWLGLDKSYSADLLTQSLVITDGAGVEWLLYTDEEGRITDLEDGEGGMWSWSHNSDGQVETVIDPEGRTITYEYDSYGNLYQKTDDEGNTWSTWWSWTGDRWVRAAYEEPDGDQFYFSRDTDGNPETLYSATLSTSGSSLSGASGLTAVETWSWTANGDLESWTKGSLSMEFDYDADGLLTGITNIAGVETTYSYDSYGRLESSTTPEGVALNYSYDSTHPTLVSDIASGSTTVLSYGYDALGRLETLTDADGNVTTYTYGSDGLLSQVDTDDGATWSYTRDAGGRVTQIDGDSGYSVSTSFDAAGRVESVDLDVSLP